MDLSVRQLHALHVSNVLNTFRSRVEASYGTCAQHTHASFPTCRLLVFCQRLSKKGLIATLHVDPSCGNSAARALITDMR